MCVCIFVIRAHHSKVKYVEITFSKYNFSKEILFYVHDLMWYKSFKYTQTERVNSKWNSAYALPLFFIDIVFCFAFFISFKFVFGLVWLSALALNLTGETISSTMTGCVCMLCLSFSFSRCVYACVRVCVCVCDGSLSAFHLHFVFVDIECKIEFSARKNYSLETISSCIQTNKTLYCMQASIYSSHVFEYTRVL